jgi:exopolyphosphatase/guanosine-5'-triphosphate,3'-diphosphate pyrophosphatase
MRERARRPRSHCSAASRLERDGNAVLLRMNASHADLVGDAVQRRLKVLGNVLGLEPKLIVV